MVRAMCSSNISARCGRVLSSAFKKTAKPGDYFIFCPELLSDEYNYARMFRTPVRRIARRMRPLGAGESPDSHRARMLERSGLIDFHGCATGGSSTSEKSEEALEWSPHRSVLNAPASDHSARIARNFRIAAGSESSWPPSTRANFSGAFSCSISRPAACDPACSINVSLRPENRYVRPRHAF